MSNTNVSPNLALTLEQTLEEIEKIGTQKASGLRLWSRPEWEVLFAPIEEKADSCIQQLIGALPADEQKLRTLADLIKGRREKLPLSSRITGEVVGVCKQILAFGAAGLALTVGFHDKLRSLSLGAQKFVVIVGIFYVDMLLLALLVLAWYMLQAHFRYPFLYFSKIGNAWPWFYYASISREVRRAPIQTAKARSRAGVLYSLDFLRFAQRCLSETAMDRLRNELQQYFLLISYQGYVQQFALRLANLFFYGFAGAVLSAIFLGIVVWIWRL